MRMRRRRRRRELFSFFFSVARGRSRCRFFLFFFLFYFLVPPPRPARRQHYVPAQWGHGRSDLRGGVPVQSGRSRRMIRRRRRGRNVVHRRDLPLLRQRASERGEPALCPGGGAEPGFLEPQLPCSLLLSGDIAAAPQGERERGLDGGEQREEERRRRSRRGGGVLACRRLFAPRSLLLSPEALAEERDQGTGERRGLCLGDGQADRRRRRHRRRRCRRRRRRRGRGRGRGRVGRPFRRVDFLLRRLEGLARGSLDRCDELVAAGGGEGGGGSRHFFRGRREAARRRAMDGDGRAAGSETPRTFFASFRRLL